MEITKGPINEVIYSIQKYLLSSYYILVLGTGTVLHSRLWKHLNETRHTGYPLLEIQIIEAKDVA